MIPPTPCRAGRLARPAVALAVVLVALGARAAGNAPAPLVYVALGDSTAAGQGGGPGGGYPPRLARRLEAAGLGVKLVNLGVAGATAGDLRRDQLPRALEARPGLVTVGIGINDLVQGRPLREFARDLEIVADFLKQTRATVVISSLPDLVDSPSAKGAPAALARRLDQFNAAIERVAERHGFLVADAFGETRRAVRRLGAGAVFSGDGFHPSAAGYDAWADALRQPVERALGARLQGRRPPAPPAAARP
ncbi:lipolytic protein G-D-S-L family [Anaeromyxobacter sp. K]|uniref:SGNH/GDSL hydrolase family protein n=1 Tax=Anaeromyxobacter sp. (strain K) TaxID=447217 RepID=UPI00015F9B39|nr:GDSL-type esterase/lipase family protein [Anaeromyxobacter sp. K]ACG71317.1 lipolytic protein G-D-S-L family [Anaeromyxobacter sp. K]